MVRFLLLRLHMEPLGAQSLDDVDAKEAKKVDEGGHKGNNDGHLRDGNDMERIRVSDLFERPDEQVIDE